MVTVYLGIMCNLIYNALSHIKEYRAYATPAEALRQFVGYV